MDIKIKIQYFNGCPHSSEMIKRAQSAISNLNYYIDYEEVLVETNELAQSLKFRGSPTLLINGEDFYGEAEPNQISLSCRYYPNGLPTEEEIRMRIIKIGSKM